MQSQQLPPQRPLSQENIKAYFSSDSSHPQIMIIACTFVGAVIGIALLISGKAITVALALLGLCFVVGGGCLFIDYKNRQKKPTDGEFDSWLKDRIRYLYNENLQVLGIDPQQIVGEVLFFRSYVLPSSQTDQHNRGEKIHLKMGKDGRIRPNITVYTYFIPTQDFIGVIVFDINALRPNHHSQYYQQYNRPYSYRSIMTPAIKVIERQRVLYNGTACPCDMEKLTVTIREGTLVKTIEITAAVRATLIIDERSIRVTPTANLERRVNLLRQLLIKHE